MVGVEYCSYSIFVRELESLSKLTALTWIKCSREVIHSNLGLSFKLTWYPLKVGQSPVYFDIYGRIMDLQVTETTPLGALISHMLRKSALVLLCRKGSKNVLIKLLMDRFQNLKDLSLGDCESVEQLLDTDVDFVATSWNFVFPLLELESLGRLSLWNVEGICCCFPLPLELFWNLDGFLLVICPHWHLIENIPSG